jgi:glycosyltransferase involved in cell wall biosynthesis
MWPYELDINHYNSQEIGLAKSFIRKGNICDIVLYTKGNSREEEFIFDGNKKIHIYYMKAKNILKNCFYDKKLYTIINNYDIIQTTEYDQLANIKLYKILKEKLIIYHGPYKSSYTKGYNLKCLFSDFIILFNKKYKNVKCYSKSKLATDFLKSKGFNNTITIGVGLDFDRLNERSKRNKKIDDLYNNKKDKKYLLYIGKIENRRNILFLLDVLKECIKYDKTIKLIIVGKGDANYLEKCQKKICDNNLTDNVIYFEAFDQSELSNLYSICDMFLLPTNYEIFGMVLLEAMYFKMPIITTLNGGSSTLIENKKNGFICNLNIDLWKNTILENINSNNKEISKNANKTIINYFSWENISKKYLENLE